MPYDNKNPRDAEAKLKGLGKRAHSAMNNHAEGYQFFAVPLILNIFVYGPNNGSTAVMIWAIIHTASRFVHLVTYLSDTDKIRSLAFIAGAVANFALFITPLTLLN